ncbi:MAG: hypothetical protein U9Q74_09210 [Gemmatimonadota bacterium]|nr:hypothetical protein [Gemmatimonadota bacterium]
MLVVREVIYCRPGQVGPLLKRFKALSSVLTDLGERPFRLMTDVAGERFWTLVAEQEAESIDAFRAMEQRVMATPMARDAMGAYHELILKGRREIYSLES